MSITSVQRFEELHKWVAGLREPLAREYEFFVEAQKGLERVITGYYGSELVKYVHGVSICGTKNNPRLCAYVSNEGDLAYEAELVTSVTGLSIDEVNIIPTKAFGTLLATPQQVTCGWRNNKYRPVPVGCGVMGRNSDCSYLYGVPAGCSLGFLGADRYGNVVVVSANHCLAGTVCGGGPGYYVVQPDDICGGNCPGDVIAQGVVTKDYGSGVWPIDAAYATATVPVQYAYLSDQKAIPFPGPTSAVSPSLGMQFTKYGRGIYTYSTRSGTISGINGTIQVYCSGIGSGSHTFYPVFTYGDTISPGDSGSGAYESSTFAPVGLNFAGNMIMGASIYATEIEKELGITLLTAPPPAISPSTLTMLAVGAAAVLAGVGVALAAPPPGS